MGVGLIPTPIGPLPSRDSHLGTPISPLPSTPPPPPSPHSHLPPHLHTPFSPHLLTIPISRAGNWLICSLLICSFAHFAQIKWATVSDSLRSLKTNERPWANPSGHLEEMSDCERITQVAQRKWATLSKLLRSLKTNERPWAICSVRSEEMSKWAIRSKYFG